MCACVSVIAWCDAGAPSPLTTTQISWEPISHRWAQLWRLQSRSRFIYTQFLRSSPNEGSRRRKREGERTREEEHTFLDLGHQLMMLGADLWGFHPNWDLYWKYKIATGMKLLVYFCVFCARTYMLSSVDVSKSFTYKQKKESLALLILFPCYVNSGRCVTLWCPSLSIYLHSNSCQILFAL